MNLAPIILFVYNRPWHTQQTLVSLMRNDLANESVLYIYCDGPKANATKEDFVKIDQVRTIIRGKQWCKEVIIKERQENIGLANSIIEGVTEIVNKHGNIIVLEDDIVTSVGFLKYMNDALKHYEQVERVMHISGFMYPHVANLPETFFFNVPLCWGWATWSSSWQFFNNDSLYLWNAINKDSKIEAFDKFGSDNLSSQLAHNISGFLKTWFIKWHSTVFLKNGFTLYPNISLVNNIGFDNTGVHNGDCPEFKNIKLADYISVKEIGFEENSKASKIIKSFYENLTKPKVHKLSWVDVVKRKIKFFVRRLFFIFFIELKNERQNIPKITKNRSYVGQNCLIYGEAKLANSIIGNYTYIAQNSIINDSIIGKFCSIGPNLISGWGIHPINGVSTHPMFYSTLKQNGMTLSQNDKILETKQIIIGNDVFIGMNVTILDGITIGDGAVIGAGAVVSKNIPPYAVAVGNPIKIVKYRFDDLKIDKLLKLKWWNFEKENLYLVEKHFFEIDSLLTMFDDESK